MATHGNTILVYSNSTLIAGTRSDEANTDADVIEISSSTQSQWRSYIAGRKGGSITVGYLVLSTSALGISGGTGIRDLLQVGNSFTLVIKPRNSNDGAGVSGSYILKSVNIQAQRFNLVQGSFQFVLNGQPT